MNSRKSDTDLAFELHNEMNPFGVTENAIVTDNKYKKNYKPRTLIDQTLELIDPTPNIFTLFVQFNERFFWNILLPVEVKWSTRMTSCAGTCTFHPRNRQCVITLSAPLLKLRPRKDLVETLLHEMIHGYLFLTNNNRDRDGHGPEFCKHMTRINKEAGTNITIYHSFHDEVRLYQQHWWRCNGPCQKRSPYFGTVRRAMNRAPGPTDYWWKQHQQTCGGEFIKIKEPDNFKTKNSKAKDKERPTTKSTDLVATNKLFNWLGNTSSSTITKPMPAPNIVQPHHTNSSSGGAIRKLGTSTNNVYGWGTSGPNSFNKSNTNKSKNSPVSRVPMFSGANILGGFKTGRSNLLNKYDAVKNNNTQKIPNEKISRNTIDTWINKSPTNNAKVVPINKNCVEFVQCPICNYSVPNNDINCHIDKCLLKENEKNVQAAAPTSSTGMMLNHSTPTKKRKSNSNIFTTKHPKIESLQNSQIQSRCPLCDQVFLFSNINAHLDSCLSESNINSKSPTVINDSNCDTSKNESVISISSSSDSDLSPSMVAKVSRKSTRSPTPSTNSVKRNEYKCLVCNSLIGSQLSLNDHLEDCIESVFKDDLTLSDCESEGNSESDVPKDDKVPCPVCMKLISECRMNEHLDLCLQNT